MHDASVVCPVAFLPYLPEPQSVQLPLPPPDLYLPAAHAVHVPPSGPAKPALQVHLAPPEAPDGEVEFDGQAMHVVRPTAGEYVPVPQLMQGVDQ